MEERPHIGIAAAAQCAMPLRAYQSAEAPNNIHTFIHHHIIQYSSYYNIAWAFFSYLAGGNPLSAMKNVRPKGHPVQPLYTYHDSKLLAPDSCFAELA